MHNTNIKTALERAKTALADAQKLYADCDSENRWREYRLLVEARQARVDKLTAEQDENTKTD